MTDLDLRFRELTIDGVHQAIRDEYFESAQYPFTLIITPEQEESLLAEWKSAVLAEDAPESLSEATLWGQEVKVMAR